MRRRTGLDDRPGVIAPDTVGKWVGAVGGCRHMAGFNCRHFYIVFLRENPELCSLTLKATIACRCNDL